MKKIKTNLRSFKFRVVAIKVLLNCESVKSGFVKDVMNLRRISSDYSPFVDYIDYICYALAVFCGA
ncbi:27922_t:CDS:2 [Gigaspora margarita]|uniref:27922_t:CDS:1 n=1 Tax=Gigaspora margarita TaxID=4874 RepID=A0ABN7ULJ7_GIGMA|nr:27922_t:CDS:2 [Gigaspora margarita]